MLMTLSKRLLTWLFIGSVVLIVGFRNIIDALAGRSSAQATSWAANTVNSDLLEWIATRLNSLISLIPDTAQWPLSALVSSFSLPAGAIGATGIFMASVVLLQARSRNAILVPVGLSIAGGLMAGFLVLWSIWLLELLAPKVLWLLVTLWEWGGYFVSWLRRWIGVLFHMITTQPLFPIVLGLIALLAVVSGIVLVLKRGIGRDVLFAVVVVTGIALGITAVVYLVNLFGWVDPILAFFHWFWNAFFFTLGLLLVLLLFLSIFALPGAFVSEALRSSFHATRDIKVMMNVAASVGLKLVIPHDFTSI